MDIMVPKTLLKEPVRRIKSPVNGAMFPVESIAYEIAPAPELMEWLSENIPNVGVENRIIEEKHFGIVFERTAPFIIGVTEAQRMMIKLRWNI
jgi:hypothetical protein